MPARYSVHPEINVVFIRYEGTVETEEVVDAYKAYCESAQYDAAYNHLIDMSGATTLNIDFARMIFLVSRISALSTLRATGCKTALFAPGDVQFGVGRMYQSIAEVKVDFEIGVFRASDESVTFLGLNPDDVLPVWKNAFEVARNAS